MQDVSFYSRRVLVGYEHGHLRVDIVDNITQTIRKKQQKALSPKALENDYKTPKLNP